MKCRYCGKDVPDNSKYCDGCGASFGAFFVNVKVREPLLNNNSNNNNKRKGSKLVIIFLSIIIIVGIILGLFFFIKGNKNNNNESNNVEDKNTENNVDDPNKKSNKELLDNIGVELFCQTETSECVIKLTNNNDETVDLLAKNILFLNKDNTDEFWVSNPEYIYGLAAGKSVYLPEWAGYGEVSQFVSCSMDLYMIKDVKVRNHIDELAVSSNDNKEQKNISVTIKNNANEDLDNVNVVILYYRGDTIVASESSVDFMDYYEKTVEGIKKGQELTAIVEYPKNRDNKTYINFDRYEVVVNEAFAVYEGMDNYR